MVQDARSKSQEEAASEFHLFFHIRYALRANAVSVKWPGEGKKG